ncbi:MAG: 5'-nucleotidase C-terminal domain-containing protein [Candidatus Bipolaricaulis sp.]|nr:5'-nucleotidase C-terminal domain-containing protein [Candidatus Bipolaricaulis sp.]MDD5646051.1 5'-nucleotidase C-terminal domain-containing protein [Candidatus Bipolaricaulis sp.]
MNWKLILVGLTILLCLGVGLPWKPTNDNPLRLTILHTNDVHAHYDSFSSGGGEEVGGIARIATLAGNIRGEADHVVLFDAGDQFQGSLYFHVGGADAVAAVMNATGYDGMAIGNHEFDSGPAELARLIDRAEFPVLSANTTALAEPTLAGKVAPFDVFLVDGETIAVFGLTTETTSSASSPGPNVTFSPAIRSAAAIVGHLERQGIDKIIALTHLGYEQDLQLAKSVSGIDVIVGGHSHTSLGGGPGAAGPYPTMVKSSTGEPVAVVTAGEWGQVLGRLDVTFDARGIVRDAKGSVIPVTASISPHPGVAAVLAGYQDDIAALMETAVGRVSVDLDGERAAVRSRETNLGNLICDAMLWKTTSLGAQVALQNGGGIRASVPAGDITMGQVLEILPFGNEITVLSVTGAQLRAALENGVSQVAEGGGRFPQVAGVRFAFDPQAAPGARVTAVDVWSLDAMSYQPLAAEETVVVATNTFLAEGGDGYAAFAAGTRRYDTGWLLSDTLAEYLAATSPASPEVEGRIQAPEAP